MGTRRARAVRLGILLGSVGAGWQRDGTVQVARAVSSSDTDDSFAPADLRGPMRHLALPVALAHCSMPRVTVAPRPVVPCRSQAGGPGRGGETS